MRQTLARFWKARALASGVAVSGHERQGEDGRIVLRRATAVADLDDAVHGANTVRLDAADDRVVVLLHQIALADVIGAALGAEDQEPVEPGPVIDLPGVAAARVGAPGSSPGSAATAG